MSKHGHYAGDKPSITYSSWDSMIGRCFRSSNASYARYGGSGISVCDRWRKFENFLEDMGARPSEGFSIERIDSKSGYCVENCKWATDKEQAQNRESTNWIESGGLRLTASDWARKLGLTRMAVTNRIRRGWSHEMAVTTPSKRKHHVQH